MKTHLHIAAAALVGRFRISVHTEPKEWHRNGYHKSDTRNCWTETCNVTRELAYGWVAVAYITTIPNPDYNPETD